MFWIKISLCVVLSSRDPSCKWHRAVNGSFEFIGFCVEFTAANYLW